MLFVEPKSVKCGLRYTYWCPQHPTCGVNRCPKSWFVIYFLPQYSWVMFFSKMVRHLRWSTPWEWPDWRPFRRWHAPRDTTANDAINHRTKCRFNLKLSYRMAPKRTSRRVEKMRSCIFGMRVYPRKRFESTRIAAAACNLLKYYTSWFHCNIKRVISAYRTADSGSLEVGWRQLVAEDVHEFVRLQFSWINIIILTLKACLVLGHSQEEGCDGSENVLCFDGRRANEMGILHNLR